MINLKRCFWKFINTCKNTASNTRETLFYYKSDVKRRNTLGCLDQYTAQKNNPQELFRASTSLNAGECPTSLKCVTLSITYGAVVFVNETPEPDDTQLHKRRSIKCSWVTPAGSSSLIHCQIL